MKKITLLTIVLFLISNISYSQLTKGNWLLGGNGNFSSMKFNYADSLHAKINSFQLSPRFGYFFTNKFAAGLTALFKFAKTEESGYRETETSFDYGPFLRYYFLPVAKQINLFAEADYLHSTTNSKSTGDIFSFSAGPVYYFNPSVGLEFTAGYSYSNKAYGANVNHVISVGLGLQIHFKKKK